MSIETIKKQIKRIVDWQYFLPAIFCVLFLVLRLPALFMPYHQDEYKWAMAVGFEDFFSPSIPHPPLARFVYVVFSVLLGNQYLRLMPTVLSLVTLLVMFSMMKRYYGRLSAIVALFLFSIIPYSLLGSLQIDIDGAVLPLFTIITFYGYMMWRESSYVNHNKLAIAIFGLIGGFLSKLSFVIVPLSILIIEFWDRYSSSLNRQAISDFVSRFRFQIIGVLTLAILGYVFSEHIFIFRYVKNFTHFSGRNYFELLFLSLKAIIYLSPILIISPFIDRVAKTETRLWRVFLFVSFMFYAVVFDFSHRTLDRYWMVVVLPLVVISSVITARALRGVDDKQKRIVLMFASLTSVICLVVFALSHEALPLNPKTEFLKALSHFKWNILVPMSGGSGPLGFYLPLDGVICFFGLAILAIGLRMLSRKKDAFVVFVFVISVFYSGLVDVEYLFGSFYGSSTQVLNKLLVYVKDNSDIKQVMDYNDSGAYDLIQMNKYYKRFYADPAFVDSNKDKFAEYNGYFLVLDFPRIDRQSFYGNYLSSCKQDKVVEDKYITGFVLDCRLR